MAHRRIDRYEPKKMEAKWQKAWVSKKLFAIKKNAGKKAYILEMFPYPSGRIHMGHVRVYSIGDVIARFRRHQGYNVLHPMGFDAFGLPAENAAIQNNVHPKTWTYSNIKNMEKQLRRLGLGIDWSRQVTTCDPEYYKWEQLLFIEMFEKGLAYRKCSRVNWCPSCQTVLANEQVEGGKCWRCDHTVVQKELNQWFLKITAYAEELLQGLKELEGGWPERVLTMQRNWIGKSEGALIDFPLEGSSEKIRVFTTRPDTLFGVTFLSLAPEHPLVETFRSQEISQFVEQARKTSAEDRAALNFEKQGVFTGKYGVHPMSGERVPIYLTNFVIMEYGTGAVMGVPAHDERDFAFAKKYDLPLEIVIAPSNREILEEDLESAYTEPGTMVNSQEFNGIDNEEAKVRITSALKAKGMGEPSITYRLRDWGISRQRYWGAPIPMIHCKTCGPVPVPKKDLPVKLPTKVPFSGKGGSPLEQTSSFVNTKCPTCNAPARRETDTMDTFMESSWYFLRYCSPKYEKGIFDPRMAEFWMPVDQYIGGIEHAILHLLYSRFIMRVLRDLGLSNVSEPFTRLLSQGMVIKDGEKMSKSRGNVVDPDYLIDKYGADTVRLFTLFAAPVEKDLDWSDQGVEGASRFLDRFWRFVLSIAELSANAKKLRVKELANDPLATKIYRYTHKMLKTVTEDLNRFHFNTAISSVMDFVNKVTGEVPQIWEHSEGLPSSELSKTCLSVLQFAAKTSLLATSPFVPHVSEELWKRLKGKGLLAEQPWPSYDPDWAKEDQITVVIQVNGKVRGKIETDRGKAESILIALAQKDDNVRRFTDGKIIRKTIFVPDRLINLVVT